MELVNVLTYETLLLAESQCINAQDAIVVRLLLEGIEVHEIVYLKADSLDLESRTLTITDSYGIKRRQGVSPRTVQMYKRALLQNQYIADQRRSNLKDNGYLIKATLNDYIAHESMIQEMDSVILRTIYRRFRELSEKLELPELAYLTTLKLELNHVVIA